MSRSIKSIHQDNNFEYVMRICLEKSQKELKIIKGCEDKKVQQRECGKVLYILFDPPSVFIQSHISDFKRMLILEGRQVIFLVLRALKSLR